MSAEAQAAIAAKFAPTLYSRTLDTISGEHESYLYDGHCFDTAAAFAAGVLARVEAESA